MTKIRIKIPSYKREITILLLDATKHKWQLSAIGYTPIEFESHTLGQAVENGLMLKDNLQPDPVYVEKQRAKGVRLQETLASRASSAAAGSASSLDTPAAKSGPKFRDKNVGTKDDAASTAVLPGVA